MSEKRFTYDKPLVAFSKGGINDNVTGETYEFTMDTVLNLLNEQQATIEQLQAQLREKEEDEQLYANEIVKLNKEAKEVLDFKSLGGDY